jgi:hypothetical protein
MSHKYVTKVVWQILVQLRSLNNTMSLVSGVRPSAAGFGCQVSGFRKHKQLKQRPTVITQQLEPRILTPEH